MHLRCVALKQEKMISQKTFIKSLIVAFIFMLALFSCKEKEQMLSIDDWGIGTLKGKISIGPLCPVETYPPSPACQPTMETYKNWATAVWTKDKKLKVMDIKPNLDGSYEIGIEEGEYVIDFISPHNSGIGSSNLPHSVIIDEGDTSKFDITIDTGIR
jgi:hypothetical protein